MIFMHVPVHAAVKQQPTVTVEIAIAAIPLYLHDSEFYQALDKDDQAGSIAVPAGCFKDTDRISNIEDLMQLLRVLMFWGLYAWPQSILNYCSETDISRWEHAFNSALHGNVVGDMRLFKEYFRYPGNLEYAVRLGRREFIYHWMKLNPPGSEHARIAVNIAVGKC